MDIPNTSAMDRVVVTEDATLEDATRLSVDYSDRIDVARLMVNPEHVPPEALDGYRTNAAVAASLEGFRRYNRGITRKYGTFENEQKAFDTAFEKASEELTHLALTAPRSPGQLLAALREVDDDALLSIEGFGPKKLEALRKALT